MIRRGLWLAVGAAGGIMGYRRAAALGRRLSVRAGSQRVSQRGAATARRPARRSLARDALRATRQARGFTRDVREGMELYMARHPQATPPTLPAKPNDVTASDVTAKDDR
jgi:hypothetical protein